MQKIRATTQIFDDDHLLLTPADIERLYNAIITDPVSGEYKVYTLQRNDEGGWRIGWEETPEA